MKLINSSLPLVSLRLLLLFLSIALFSQGTVYPSHANGRVLDYQVKDAEPYQIGFGSVPSLPRVGTIHVSVTVTALNTENTINDPKVYISAFGPGKNAGNVEPIQAVRQTALTSVYEANTEVDTVGTWTFMVSVSSDIGGSSAKFMLEVQPSNPFLEIMSWLTLTVFIALILLGLYPFIVGRVARLKLKWHYTRGRS